MTKSSIACRHPVYAKISRSETQSPKSKTLTSCADYIQKNNTQIRKIKIKHLNENLKNPKKKLKN